MTRVYLAGPMTGRPDYGAVAFEAAATHARERGWTPVSPLDTRPKHDGPCPDGLVQSTPYGTHAYGCWFRASVATMLGCDSVLMLAGWQGSQGAALEHAVAKTCGMPVHYLS